MVDLRKASLTGSVRARGSNRREGIRESTDNKLAIAMAGIPGTPVFSAPSFFIKQQEC